jgi:hypothetical protein
MVFKAVLGCVSLVVRKEAIDRRRRINSMQAGVVKVHQLKSSDVNVVCS